jgi:hypothetical protein
MSLPLLKKEAALAERLEKVDRYAKDVTYGPATFFGFKVTVLEFSDRYVWFKCGDKELRAYRHWIYGNARQEGKHVI